jgi:hypothetical protein
LEKLFTSQVIEKKYFPKDSAIWVLSILTAEERRDFLEILYPIGVQHPNQRGYNKYNTVNANLFSANCHEKYI